MTQALDEATCVLDAISITDSRSASHASFLILLDNHQLVLFRYPKNQEHSSLVNDDDQTSSDYGSLLGMIEHKNKWDSLGILKHATKLVQVSDTDVLVLNESKEGVARVNLETLTVEKKERKEMLQVKAVGR